MRLAETTSPAVTGAGLVLVPVGSLEQHGPHLPLDTDTVVAVAVATAAARRLDCWVAPAITYGASGEHQSFPGTVSIGTEALRMVVIELVRSLRSWAGRVVLVNGHGGNVEALRGAVDQLVAEGQDVTWVPCAAGSVDAHAGRTETSLMLHLRAASVQLERAEAGETRPLRDLLPLIREGGVGAVSPNGVLGDPAGATAEEGEAVLRAMVDDVVARVSRPGP